MLDLLRAAGWPICFLLIASFLSVTFVLERLYTLRRSSVLPTDLFQQVVAEYRQRGADLNFFQQLRNHSPLGRIFACVLRLQGCSRQVIKDVIEEESDIVACELRKFLTSLGTIAAIAPLMGLFGTVVGMIQIFGAHGAVGTDPLQMAHGISVALYNTAFGLLVAVPTVVFYRHFRALTDDYVIDIELQAIRLVDVMYGFDQKAAAHGAVAPLPTATYATTTATV